MPHPVDYSLEYDRVRERLTPGERTMVGLIEDEIAKNPDPRLPGRFEDQGYIYDTKPGEFMIEYRILDNGWVYFERLLDLRNPDL